MKKILTLIVLLVGTLTFAQDTKLQAGDRTLSEKAKEITDKYVGPLGVRAEQELLFRKKVEEFLIREEKIKKTSSQA